MDDVRGYRAQYFDQSQKMPQVVQGLDIASDVPMDQFCAGGQSASDALIAAMYRRENQSHIMAGRQLHFHQLTNDYLGPAQQTRHDMADFHSFTSGPASALSSCCDRQSHGLRACENLLCLIPDW